MRINGIVDPGDRDPDKADTDGDGFPDGEERSAGTSPLDATDFFGVEVSGQSNGQIELDWRSSPGLLYIIESSDSLAPSKWNVVESNIPASGVRLRTSYLFTPDPLSKMEFYRIGVL